MNKPNTDTLILFKHAVTSLSASILLLLIGTPQNIIWLVYIFFGFSVLFLFAGFLQIFPKCKFPDFVRKLGDSFTFSFILISLAAIIRGWASILKAFTENHTTITTLISSTQSLSQFTVPIWIIVFFVFFFIVAIVDSIKNIKRTNKARGRKHTLSVLIPALLLSIFWGIIIFRYNNNSTLFFIFLAVMIIWILFKGIYLEPVRKSFMERKDKARESAIIISTIAKFIGDSMTFDYPPETIKVIVNVPMKQLEDELITLKAFISSLK